MKKQLTTVRRLVVTVIAVAGILGSAVTPATAAVLQAPVLNDANQRMGFAELSSDRRGMAACDTRGDDIGVYGRFELDGGQIIDIADDNGSASGCGRVNVPSGKTVKRFQGIARDGHKSGWVTP
jgi:hypothetical protein